MGSILPLIVPKDMSNSGSGADDADLVDAEGLFYGLPTFDGIKVVSRGPGAGTEREVVVTAQLAAGGKLEPGVFPWLVGWKRR